ncbi:MAG: GNAT family N-acetyltransferase [Egibacteraceae bacterium]
MPPCAASWNGRPHTAYALARLERYPAGVGLAVVEQGWAGIFSMATRAQARRRGVARGVLHTLANWAAVHRAERISLQVEEPLHARWLHALALLPLPARAPLRRPVTPPA